MTTRSEKVAVSLVGLMKAIQCGEDLPASNEKTVSTAKRILKTMEEQSQVWVSVVFDLSDPETHEKTVKLVLSLCEMALILKDEMFGDD